MLLFTIIANPTWLKRAYARAPRLTALLMKLLWWGNFLDHDAAGGDVTGVRVRTALESMTAVSNNQSNTYGSFANPLTISPDLTMLVYVDVCVVEMFCNDIDRFDGDWF